MELFAKALTTIDVERTSLPDVCLPSSESGGCHGELLQVKDDVGTLWNFRCILRSGVVQKLAIVSGWIQFVRFKGLNSGDVVVVYRDDDTLTGAQYKIEVKRRSNNSSNSVYKNEI